MYYMVTPDAKGREEPDDRVLMRYGSKVIHLLRCLMNRLETLKMRLSILL